MPPNGLTLPTLGFDITVPMVVAGASTHVPRGVGGIGSDGAAGFDEPPPHATEIATSRKTTNDPSFMFGSLGDATHATRVTVPAHV